MKLTTFSKSRTKFDNSSALPTTKAGELFEVSPAFVFPRRQTFHASFSPHETPTIFENPHLKSHFPSISRLF